MHASHAYQTKFGQPKILREEYHFSTREHAGYFHEKGAGFHRVQKKMFEGCGAIYDKDYAETESHSSSAWCILRGPALCQHVPAYRARTLTMQ